MLKIKKLFLLLALPGVFVLSAGCDDIIEPELSAQPLKLLSPADSAVSATARQTFRWEPVAGARQYHIQIAAPTFANPSSFFLDSVTTQPAFTATLIPASYQWRVQALNSAYQTGYATRHLRIDSTGSLSAQEVILRRPANNTYTNKAGMIFEWTALATAQRYVFTLLPSPRSAAASFDTILTGATTFKLNLPLRNQAYRWKITALNVTSLRESVTNTFEVDVTAPGVPVLTSPAEGAFFTGLPIPLTWTRSGTDVLRDSLFLVGADQLTPVASFPRPVTASSFTFSTPATSLVPGTYYWFSRSVDRAGNASPTSAKRSFILQ